MVKEWLGLPSIWVHEWSGELSIDEWWSSMSYKASLIRKVMTSLTMLLVGRFGRKEMQGCYLLLLPFFLRSSRVKPNFRAPRVLSI
jgi:hypothetical protein